jgi:hypothetical protein
VFVGTLTPPKHLIPSLVYPDVCVRPILWFSFFTVADLVGAEIYYLIVVKLKISDPNT